MHRKKPPTKAVFGESHKNRHKMTSFHSNWAKNLFFLLYHLSHHVRLVCACFVNELSRNSHRPKKKCIYWFCQRKPNKCEKTARSRSWQRNKTRRWQQQKNNNRRLHSTHLFICSPFQMELVCFFFIFLSLLAPTSNQPKASNYVNFLANFIFLSQFQIHLCKVDFLESEIWRKVWLALIHWTPLIFCLFWCQRCFFQLNLIFAHFFSPL